MSQRQNLSNKPETKRQFNAKNKYTSSSSSQNKSSKITPQQKTSQYKKIDNTLSNNDKILHHSNSALAPHQHLPQIFLIYQSKAYLPP